MSLIVLLFVDVSFPLSFYPTLVLLFYYFFLFDIAEEPLTAKSSAAI